MIVRLRLAATCLRRRDAGDMQAEVILENSAFGVQDDIAI